MTAAKNCFQESFKAVKTVGISKRGGLEKVEGEGTGEVGEGEWKGKGKFRPPSLPHGHL